MTYDWQTLPTREVTLRDCAITLRPLQASDAPALGAYFLSLSDRTREVYGPHPFTQAMADEICAHLASPAGQQYLRLLALHGSQVLGYFIVYLGLHGGDRQRRYQELDPALTCTLAPSVADAWQNGGLGSHLMSYAKDCARHFGKTTMVLWSGVRADNPRAIHFYTKHGFTRHGDFTSQAKVHGIPQTINNHDMSVVL
jgi:diamine N-acetyltransferase